jgi:hypothetical protein
MQRLTAQQMKDNFLVLYDKVTNFAAPGYEDNEISLFLTSAQDQLVKRYYNYKGNKYREGFEETEKRRKDLSELIRHSDINCSNNTPGISPASANGILVDLPTDVNGNNLVLYTLREEVAIQNATDSCYADGTILEVKPVTHDEYTASIKNPFKKPDITKVWRLDFSSDNNGPKRHELITDGSYGIATYKLRYLKVPSDIVVSAAGNQDCELNASMHQEIVNVAVRIATGVTDPVNYQIKMNEEQQSE